MIKLTVVMHKGYWRFGPRRSMKKKEGLFVSMLINENHILYVYEGENDHTEVIMTEGNFTVKESMNKINEIIDKVNNQ